MLVMFILSLITSSCLITVTSYDIKTGKFSVTSNMEVDQAQIQPDGTRSVKNLIACVHWFHTREDACFGDFNNSTKICNIFTLGCCDTYTKAKTGVYIFKRDLTGFSQQTSDCSYYKNQEKPSGVYQIKPEGIPNGFSVYCDMETDNGGWTVIQKRFDGSVDFYRDWDEYKAGFGVVNGEYWLGNEYLHIMTASGGYVLRINMEDSDGAKYAAYYTFAVASEEDNYRLTLGQHCGTAYDDGDYGMSLNDNSQFSTEDQNTAFNHGGENCSWIHQSGWWFKPTRCTTVNLNGEWNPGVQGNKNAYWFDMRSLNKGLNKISMMIRRK